MGVASAARFTAPFGARGSARQVRFAFAFWPVQDRGDPILIGPPLPADPVQITLPQQNWTLFNTTRGDLPQVVFVNRALLGFQHLAIFPWHLSIRIAFRQFIDNRMPAPEESQRLARISAELEDAMEALQTDQGAPNVLPLARSTWDGVRELAFQVHDPELADQTLRALVAREDWALDWSYEMRDEPAWDAAHAFLLLFRDPKHTDA